MDTVYGSTTAANTHGFSSPQSEWTANSYVEGFAIQAGVQAVFFELSGDWASDNLGLYVSPDGGATFQSISSDYIYDLTLKSFGSIGSAATGPYVLLMNPNMVAAGSVYIGATGMSDTWSGTLDVVFKTGSAMDFIDVTTFGAVGDGVTDDTAAIQMAINAASQSGNNRGVLLIFPPGNYVITSPLVMPTNENLVNIVFQGFPFATTSSQVAPRSILTFIPPSVDSSLITFSQGTAGINAPNGLAFRDLGFVYDDSAYIHTKYVGPLLDLSGNPTATKNSSNIEIKRCSFYPSSGSFPNCIYLYLDGSIGVVVSNCSFNGANYAVQGVGMTALSMYAGFQNLAKFCDGTQFANQATAPILNPGASWSFDSCRVEPNASGAAAFITMDYEAGYSCSALGITNCWMGDDLSDVPGTWVEFEGDGLHMANNTISCQQSTTGVQFVAGSTSTGICILANRFDGNGGASVGIDVSQAASVGQFTCLGNSFTYVTTDILSYELSPTGLPLPVGPLSSTVGDIANFTNAQFAATAGAAIVNAGTQIGTNRLPFDDATFYNQFATPGLYYATTDWGDPYECTIGPGGTIGLPNKTCMALTASGGAMAVAWPSSGAAGMGLRGVPVIPNTNATVTVLAKFQSGSSTTREVEIEVYRFAPDGVATLIGTGPRVLEGAPGTWVQNSFSIAVPSGYTSVGILFLYWQPTIESGEVHYVADVSVAIGTPWYIYSEPAGASGDAPQYPPTLQITGTSISQLGTTTTSVGIGVGSGGAGGLVVGNGSTGLGPITGGSLALAVVPTLVNYNIGPNDWLVECDADSAGAMVVNLPEATTAIAGRQYVVLRTGSNTMHTVTVYPYSGQYIFPSLASYALAGPGNSVTLVCDGTQWLITSKI